MDTYEYLIDFTMLQQSQFSRLLEMSGNNVITPELIINSEGLESILARIDNIPEKMAMLAEINSTRECIGIELLDETKYLKLSNAWMDDLADLIVDVELVGIMAQDLTVIFYHYEKKIKKMAENDFIDILDPRILLEYIILLQMADGVYNLDYVDMTFDDANNNEMIQRCVDRIVNIYIMDLGLDLPHYVFSYFETNKQYSKRALALKIFHMFDKTKARYVFEFLKRHEK